MINPELQNAFRWHMRAFMAKRAAGLAPFSAKLQRDMDSLAGGVAKRAIALARADVAQGKRRYPSGYRGGNGVCWQSGKPGLAYVEKPESVGLRLVGKVEAECGGRNGYWSNRETCGWYTDPYGDVFRDGTGLCWGVVYQLSGRNGESRFVAGYQFGGCDGGPTLDLGTIYSEPRGEYDTSPTEQDATRDAARSADSMAQHAAEEEREYQTAWQAGSAYASEGETIAEARQAALAILKERHAVKGDKGAYPALCAAIRDRVTDLLSTISEARAKRANLAAGDEPDLYFYSGEKRLQDAFCEGAGLESFPA